MPSSRKRVFTEYAPTHTKKNRITMYKKSKPAKKKLVSSSDNKVVSLPYVEWQNVTMGAVAQNVVLTYRGNGMYDPDYALGGHQPMGFDQYIALYNKYYVKSATIKVSVWAGPLDTNSANNNDAMLFVWADTDAAGPAVGLDAKTVAERCMAHNGRMQHVGNTYNTPKVLSLKAFTKDICDKGFQSEDTSGTSSSDPFNVWFFHAVVCDPLTAYPNKPLQILTRISYDAMFYDSKELGTS